MTIPVLLSFGVTGDVADDTSFSVFQLANGPAGTVIVCGNFFLGLQSSIAVRIPMGELLGVHRGATLETVLTQATIGLVANSAWGAGGSININCMVDTGPRGAADSVPNGDTAPASQQLDAQLAFKPPGGFGPSWRRDYSGVFDMRLEDTGGTPFVDTGVATGGSFGLRTVVGAREQLAMRFVVAGGPWSVARIDARMRRFGAPIGDCEFAIQTNQSDGYGHDEPDGVDLGTTAAVLNSTLPLNPGIGLITYAFTPDLVLPDGTYWAVLRPVTPYPISQVNFIVWGQRRLFVANGGSHRTPLGFRFDQALYPGHIDVNADVVAKEVGPAVVWAIPAAVAGQLMTTPDIQPLVEEVIRNAGHETIHALIFSFRTVGQTLGFRFAAHGHPTRSPPSWACRFVRRNISKGEFT